MKENSKCTYNILCEAFIFNLYVNREHVDHREVLGYMWQVLCSQCL